ncbi:hypothetical protein CDL12_15319 [Handroanthus impetiginosus]|uniref:F-box domain-containing protein n=1 Tax=Handroanthus impetiginosus TaxID=429701 RepID=A0A2G9H3J1_9LAMI|nr:hypothetical protein CDL12_15319 [Handroanthus impetiginosus]
MAPEVDELYLPIHVLHLMLSSLPVKSMLRFKTVSKSWNAMISDPVFVQINLQKSNDSNSQNLFLGRPYGANDFKMFHLIKLQDGKFDFEALVDCPYNLDIVLGYCDGVFLLSDSSYRTFLLWSPCNRRRALLWLPYKFESSRVHYGLCHDPTVGEFKVVIVYGEYYRVFSCKDECWSEKKEFPYPNGSRSGSGLSMNGAFYWVWRDENEPHNEEIIYFDSEDDKFKISEKPNQVTPNHQMFLVCLRGHFCLYSRHGRTNKIDKIWIIDKNRAKNSWPREPLYFVENDIVITLSIDARFEGFSICEKTRSEFEGWMHDLQLFPYVDSLFFPN